MAKDFRSDRVRTRAIIGTGSVVPLKPNLNLMFYSGSKATNYGGGHSMSMANVGNDIWLYIDGTASTGTNPKAKPAGSGVLFNGDVTVSGTLWAERSVVEVDDSVAGNFQAPNKTIAGHTKGYPDDLQDGWARLLIDPTTDNPSANRNGTISFNVVQGSSGDFAYATQFPSKHKDVFFHVSGSRGVKGTNDRGLALFDGDVMISGNLDLSLESVVTIPGDLTIGGDLTVNGNDILGSAGQAIEFLTPTPHVHVRKGLKVGNNAITGSDDTVHIYLSGSGKVGVGGDLQVWGNRIDGSAGTNITLGSAGLVAVAGNLQVNGAGIKGPDGAKALHLSGSGNATFENNLTVVGDLNVSGSVTAIGTENLRVKDAMILIASGSTILNTRGGIAIASGSKVANRSLTFGAGQAGTNRWALGYKDVQDGIVADVSDAEPVGLQLSAIHFKDITTGDFDLTFITASHVGGTSTRLDIQNGDGGIYLTPNNHIYIPSSNKLYLDGNTATVYVEADAGGDLNLVGGTQAIDLTFGTMARFINAAGNQSRIEFLKDGKGLFVGQPSTVDAAKREVTLYQGGHHMAVGSDGGLASDVNQARTSVLVLSASSDETVGGPMIMLSSSAEFGGGTSREGVIVLGANSSDANMFSMTEHRDVRTLISGSVASRGTNTRGTTLITGDLVVSGNTELEGSVNIGSIDLSNITLSSLAANEPYIRFRDVNHFVRRGTLGNLEFDDSQAPSGPYTLTQLASLAVTDNSDVFAVTHQDGTAPYLSYVSSTGSFSFDHDPTVDLYTPRRTNQIGSNVYFFVSGAIDCENTRRGKAVFGGDIHVSGSLNHTLNDAYYASGSGVRAAGNGAIIDTAGSGIPIQLRGASAGDEHLLGITGSLAFEYAGAGDATKLEMKTNHAFQFHNSAGEVFRMVAGGTSGTHVRFPGNNQVRFQDDSRYIYGLTQDAVKKLRIHNNNAGAPIQISTTAGNMEVTGSVLPGADSTYNLGSPEFRWANLYTGDLHLRNERGNWTIYEEPDMLVVVNNLTGKKYKMGLTPLEDEE